MDGGRGGGGEFCQVGCQRKGCTNREGNLQAGSGGATWPLGVAASSCVIRSPIAVEAAIEVSREGLARMAGPTPPQGISGMSASSPGVSAPSGSSGEGPAGSLTGSDVAVLRIWTHFSRLSSPTQ